MVMDNDNAPEKEEGEGDELAFDFWSDEGARRLNEALDEGRDYARTCIHSSHDFEMYFEDEDREYIDPELCDPDEETLPWGANTNSRKQLHSLTRCRVPR
jgi:hypothetical protein